MTGNDREGEAASVLRACQAALSARGGTIIDVAAGSPGAIRDWQHYPAGEIYDPLTHVQYFYHRHPAGLVAQPDAGHFHLFLRGDGMPAGVAPLVLADNAVANAPPPAQSAPLKRGHRDELCHLVGIALDASGAPVRMFTTNRWVTGETWYRADDVIRMLDRVRFRRPHSPMLLDRWIEALVALFRPEITVLLRRRDKAVGDWRWRWPRANVFEDQRLEITSICDIDVAARLEAIEMRARSSAAAPFPPRRRTLPVMAEGWGS